MAKMRGNKKTQVKGDKGKKRMLQDERVRFTLGFFVLLFALYLTLAFVSFLFSWKVDQSFEWQSVFSNATIRADNWAGKVGATFASQFMNRWFGVASFIVPFLIGI